MSIFQKKDLVILVCQNQNKNQDKKVKKVYKVQLHSLTLQLNQKDKLNKLMMKV